MYDGYLSNAEDDPEGAVPVIIKTVKGSTIHISHPHTLTHSLTHNCPPSLPHSHTENTPDIVVNSLLEGGTTLRPVSHRHLLPLIAYYYAEGEQPMLLYPKSALGTLKSLLLSARETRACVSEELTPCVSHYINPLCAPLY